MPDAWLARNCRQVGDARRGAGPSPAAARIRRIVPLPHPVPQADQLALDALVPPARALPRQLLHQLPHPGRDRRPSRRLRIGPFPAHKAPVPGQ